jgi:hypothetical protein
MMYSRHSGREVSVEDFHLDMLTFAGFCGHWAASDTRVSASAPHAQPAQDQKLA